MIFLVFKLLYTKTVFRELQGIQLEYPPSVIQMKAKEQFLKTKRLF